MTARLTEFLATLSVACLFHAGVCARAQNLLPNPGFEKGTNTPAGWRLTEGAGIWSDDALSGRHAITVEGNGQNSFAWRTERLALAAGALYRLRFAAKGGAGAGGGSIVSGVGRVNRDFHATDFWQEQAFVFAFPSDATSGYDFKPGQVGDWGNGNGRFLYPPRPSAETNQEPILDKPINSLRWENLRDGMEDYEYFWLLQETIERVQAKGGGSDLLKQARALLTMPPEISKDLTHFTTDPRPMLDHRDRVAHMIERLEAPTL